MRRLCILLSCALLSGCSGSSTSYFRHQVPSGETIVLKQTSTPGFLDPTIKRQFFIEWPQGRKESLPTVWFLHEGHNPRVVHTNDQVWIISERGLMVRAGTSRIIEGQWAVWEIRPSDDLFNFLFDYASARGFAGVTTSTYTHALRTSPITVHATAIETNSTLHYAASPREYFISPTVDRGYWLPQHKTDVDFSTHVITVTFLTTITAMPRRLVFTPTQQGAREWRFDREATERLF